MELKIKVQYPLLNICLEGCFSCKCLKPRYKNLVDNIYPPEDLKNNSVQNGSRNDMDRLKFYASSSPEKMDRIGQYIYSKVRNDLAKRKIGNIRISVYAMDKLLGIAHLSETINLFDESFLAIIQELLETSDLELQELATESFIKFACIKEETPSYHRRYDFFITKFASMCLTDEENLQRRKTLRLAGVKGLHGVIKKTIADDIVENIWKEVYMQKIMDALLHIMQSTEFCMHCSIVSQYRDEKEAYDVAANCLEELIRTVSFGHMTHLLQPILRYMDTNDIWTNNQFSVHIFHRILMAIQPKYSCSVFEALIIHLDGKINEGNEILNGVLHVLNKCITICTPDKICSNVLEMVNLLVSHLQNYLLLKEGPKEYVMAVASCLLELNSHLPGRQKLEIVSFIISKVPVGYESGAELILQKTLLGAVLSIIKTMGNELVDMRSRFNPDLLEFILPLCTCLNICGLVQGIFHVLLDRHNNLENLRFPRLPIKDISKQVCGRGDAEFIREYGRLMYGKILEALALSGNTIQSYTAFYTTLALIAIELVSSSTIADYLTAIYSLQEIAVTQTSLTTDHKVFLHIMCIVLLNIVVRVVEIESLITYCNQLIKLRKKRAPYLLPNSGVDYFIPDHIDFDLLLNQTILEKLLRNSRLDSDILNGTFSFRCSWIEETTTSTFFAKEEVTNFNNFDINSSSFSLPEQHEHKHLDTWLTFESMKSVLAENNDLKVGHKQRQEQLNMFFRTKPFNEIIFSYTSEDCFRAKIREVLNEISVSEENEQNSVKSEDEKCGKNKNIEELFPEIFYDNHEME